MVNNQEKMNCLFGVIIFKDNSSTIAGQSHNFNKSCEREASHFTKYIESIFFY